MTACEELDWGERKFDGSSSITEALEQRSISKGRGSFKKFCEVLPSVEGQQNIVRDITKV